MSKYFLLLFLSFIGFSQAQMELPEDIVKWSFSIEQNGCEATVIAKIKIVDHWHINATKLPKGSFGYATKFELKKSAAFELLGGIIEPKPINVHDDLADEDLSYHEGTITLKQKIKIISDKDFDVSGIFAFQTCNEVRCLPDKTVDFRLKVKGCLTGKVVDTSVIEPVVPEKDTTNKSINEKRKKSSISKSSSGHEEEKNNKSLGFIFLGAFGGGLLALLMPCVFPMIPMTVSFFTKRSKTRSQGIKNSFLYGGSIILIHVLLALVVIVTGAGDLLNKWSTSPGFNIFFFLMLFIFGLSFLGGFEIQLPSKWVNKADEKADKGGIVGIFFMALVLSLASFSCTGPFLGELLGALSKAGGGLNLLVGMFAFGFALALPFMLFSIFPSWLNSMPSSGGWLNVIKVFLGFLEIAFAFKFLSSADTTLQLHLLEREVFLAIWIAVFGALALYMFGKVRLPHDSPVEKLSVGRTMMATLTLAFTLYLLPGLWGAPLKLVNAFLPPDFYAESPEGVGGGGNQVSATTVEHVEGMHKGPKGLMAFNDYDKALAYAKKVNKPLFIDFTGWGCVNCRRMEQSVWGEPGVIEHLRDDVVIVSLYVDERTELPKSEQKTVKVNGRDFSIVTIGNKWTAKQIEEYKTSSQPYYVMQSPDGKDLSNGSADYQNHHDKNVFKSWLEKGLSEVK